MKFIYLNNYYSLAELLDLSSDQEWFSDIQSFLSNWLDDNQTINVKTSGSTGTPKSISLSKIDIKRSAAITNHYFNLNPSKTALLCLPAKYIAGKLMIIRSIEADMDLLLENPSSVPIKYLNTKIDFIALTPMQIDNILQRYPDQLNLIHTIIIGGGAVSSELSDKLQNIKSRCFQTYGMTETITHIALQPINGNQRSDYFQVLDGFEIDTDDRDCLTIRAEHIYNQYVITNDLVNIINSKSFKWLGRYDNVINTGGVKVHPEVIESKIESFINHPFFIIGVDDDYLGQKVVLCIEVDDKNSINEDDFLNRIKSRLSKFEIPRSILNFDCFLYTETGKIRRKATLESLK